MHIEKSKGERKNGGRNKLVNKHYQQQWEWVVLSSGINSLLCYGVFRNFLVHLIEIKLDDYNWLSNYYEHNLKVQTKKKYCSSLCYYSQAHDD